MKKQSISVINCILLVFIFLCIYGNTCYRSAFHGKGGSDFKQQVVLCCYFAISIIIAIYCICSKPYYSNKCFWIGAVYCVLYPALLLFAFICSLISPNMQVNSLNWLNWICVIIPPIVSGLYLYAALKKD